MGGGVGVPYRKGPAGTAEKLHSELVRSRGACERCGSPGPLECAHIVRRRYVATRTCERNAWCLCHHCHRIVDEDPTEFYDLIEATIGREGFTLLKNQALGNTKVWRESDWREECGRLRELLKAAA